MPDPRFALKLTPEEYAQLVTGAGDRLELRWSPGDAFITLETSDVRMDMTENVARQLHASLAEILDFIDENTR